MTDTPMKHDTLIERLEEVAENLGKYGTGRSGITDVGARHYSQVVKEAISHLKQSQWTPIEDIPEEWKDGRAILLIKNGEIYAVRWILESAYGPVWATPDGHVIFGATHAMFPPQLPKL